MIPRAFVVEQAAEKTNLRYRFLHNESTTPRPGPLTSAHFQRDEVPFRAFAGLIVRGDLAIAPVTGEAVGADQQQGLIVAGSELQRSCSRRDVRTATGDFEQST